MKQSADQCMVTIISGGGSGLGKELARKAMIRGKNVIIPGRRQKIKG